MEKPKADSRFEFVWIGDDLLFARWTGPIDCEVVDRSLGELKKVSLRSRASAVLVDTRGMSVRGNIHRQAQTVVSLFKEIGVEEIVAVVPSSLVRLVATTTGFMLNVPIKAVETMEEGLDHFRGRISHPRFRKKRFGISAL